MQSRNAGSSGCFADDTYICVCSNLVKNPAANASPAPVESVTSPTGATATDDCSALQIKVVGAAPALITTMSSSSGSAARFKTSASSVLQKKTFGFNSATRSRNFVIPKDLISEAEDASIETVIFFLCATAMHSRAAVLSYSEKSEYEGTCKTETPSCQFFGACLSSVAAARSVSIVRSPSGETITTIEPVRPERTTHGSTFDASSDATS